MSEFRIEGARVTFWLKARPRSGRDRLALDSTGELCLELRAPAAEGQANEACVRFLARTLRLPQTSVLILTGRKSRRKLVRITGRSAGETIEQLGRLVGRKWQGQSTPRPETVLQKGEPKIATRSLTLRR